MRETVQRAFASFLTVPTGVILGFVLLAFGTYAFEQSDLAFILPARDFMQDHVFGDAEATSALLGTIATGVITITSITFSLLLLALQQSAGSMTHQVFDQFLRRRTNQVYFGVFVGISLHALITLATVDPPFNPVLGATVALILTVIALYTLLLLIYSTISQMRPDEIIKTIHDHTLSAWQRQLTLVERTRRQPTLSVPHHSVVHAPRDGFVTSIDLDALARAVHAAHDPIEIVFLRPIGSYAAYQDPLAEVRAERPKDIEAVAEVALSAVKLGRQRDLARDPAYGIGQLETIAWRSISTSQQNPSPGVAAVHNMRDLLARWGTAPEEESDQQRLAVVYPDNVMARLFSAFESLSVVASESMQHQIYAEILSAFAGTIDLLPVHHQDSSVGLLLRTLAGMGDHVLTMQLDDALSELIQALDRTGHSDAAVAFRTARAELGKSVGQLNSRATRVSTRG